MKKRNRQHTPLPLFPVASFFVVALGVAAATLIVSAHGGDATKIHSCVKTALVKGAPNIRIVNPDDNCNNNETPLDWNIQGPPGPTGLPGPTGVPGTGSLGGGITGRWEGTMTLFTDRCIRPAGEKPLLAVFIQDANGNVTGNYSPEFNSTTGEIREVNSFIGKQISSQLQFGSTGSFLFTTTSQNSDSMSGTLTFQQGRPDCNDQGTWTLQRVN